MYYMGLEIYSYCLITHNIQMILPCDKSINIYRKDRAVSLNQTQNIGDEFYCKV